MVKRFLVPEEAQVSGNKIKGEAANSAASRRSDLLPPPALATQENVFHEALLEDAWKDDKGKPIDWVISLGVHLAVIAVVMIVPLFLTQAIDLGQLRYTYLVAPPLGSPVGPPPPPPAAVRPQPAPRPHSSIAPKLVAPMAIPKAVAIPHAPETPPETETGVPGGIVGGIPGGQIGGAIGGVLGGTLGAGEPSAPLPPPPAAAPAVVPSGPLRVGGQVKAPRVLFAPQPEYPPLAKQARVQGVVEIEAVIDEHGNVVQMKAVSGSGLLIPAAMRAVAQWKYEPTYLNGVPYPVDLTVEVTFHM